MCSAQCAWEVVHHIPSEHKVTFAAIGSPLVLYGRMRKPKQNAAPTMNGCDAASGAPEAEAGGDQAVGSLKVKWAETREVTQCQCCQRESIHERKYWGSEKQQSC